ncbi:hypothetical protein L1887_03764 [Cichorium endivia]|nr:hypothetical protein L1887_03764 [Cichorium endivia]
MAMSGDEILMPHQMCKAISVNRFPDGASKRPFSQKKDKSLKLRHGFFGHTRSRIADEEKQVCQWRESSVGGGKFSSSNEFMNEGRITLHIEEPQEKLME